MSEEQTEITDENVDQIVEDIHASNQNEIPMEQAPAPAAPEPETYEIKVDGQPVKATMDQLKQWAQMGHGAPNRIGELNKQLEEYKSQFETAEKYSQTYGEVDRFAQENPEWWQHVQDQYTQKQQALREDPSNPLAAEILSLRDQVSKFAEFQQSFEEQRQAQQLANEDSQLDQEIKQIQGEYGDVDWSTPDEEGRSLEYKVLKHAQDNGIPTFRAAFRDYYFDNLQSKAAEQGKISARNSVVRNTKLGILDSGQAPSQGSLKPMKERSYNDLVKESLQELQDGVYDNKN